MKRGPWSLFAISLGVFVGALDQTVVATLIPPIITDLEVPFTRLRDASWIVNGYLLGYTVAMPLVGRVADLQGRIRVFAGCMVLFALASVACGAAQSLEWLVVARVVQAIGGGAVLPVALAIASEQSGAGRASVALGIVGAVAEAGGVLGPLYGAALIQWMSWRDLFYINVPIVIVIIGLVFLLCEDRRGTGSSLDVPGAMILGAALAALTVALSQEGAFSNPSPVTVGLLALSIALWVVFIIFERRTASPLIDLGLFRRRAFSAANATNVFVGAALIVAMVNLPLWANTVMHWSATEGGLLLLRLTMFIPIGAVIGGLLTRYLGPRLPSVLGLLSCTGCFLLLTQWPAALPEFQMIRDLALGGFGFGLLLSPLTTTAIEWAGAARGGVAAAVVTLMRIVGMMIGLSALTSYGLDRFATLVADLPLPLQMSGESAQALAQRQAEYAERVLEATVTVYHEVFFAAALICLVAIVPALLLRLPRTGTTVDDTDQAMTDATRERNV